MRLNMQQDTLKREEERQDRLDRKTRWEEEDVNSEKKNVLAS